uniref:NB-ARC domain-containing protein n=1 Tax=Fagus sylvatica TaxID=28930 RepID=A0A2N9FMZ9_FAGSY
MQSRSRTRTNQVRDWLMKLRDVAYDADDVLSDFSTEDLRRRVMCGDKMAKKERDQTHSFILEEEVIGREDEKTIIDMLLNIDEEDQNVSFISIVGIGGLGKTTLAQYVYNDEKVKTYFDLQMWVCVSDVFNVKAIAEKIIESTTERWSSLKRLLMGGSKGSKVVITTRSNKVAEITNTISSIFLKACQKINLGQLTSLQTLPLFVVSKDLEASSSKHCGGLAELNKLNNLRDREITDEISASTTFFPSLKSLKLWNCPNLKGWWRDIVDAATTTSISSDQYQQHISLPSFPCLSYLDIQNCNNLTCMPLFPYLEENLILWNTSFKPLQETMAMTMNMSATSSLPSSSSSSPPLSKLKSLTLYGIQDVESLPEELLQNLASLEDLKIWECPRLKSLPRFMPTSHLP